MADWEWFLLGFACGALLVAVLCATVAAMLRNRRP